MDTELIKPFSHTHLITGINMRISINVFLAALFLSNVHVGAFDPWSYDTNGSRVATCDAIKRTVSLTKGTELGAIVEDAEHEQIQLRT